MKRDYIYVTISVVVAILLINPTHILSQPPEISGYARASIYGGGRNYDFASLFAEADIKGNYNNGNALVYANLRFRSGMSFSERYSQAEIKELYAGYNGEKISIITGYHIVNWNRFEILSPFVNLTPSNPFFLSFEPDDQRLSNFMLRIKSPITGRIKGELILIPVYRESQYRFDLYDLGEKIVFTDPELPEKRLKNGSVALRLEMTLPGADLSLSLFRGYDPDYGFRMHSFETDNAGGFKVTNGGAPYLRTSAGADFSLNAGSLIIRGGCVLNLTDKYQNEIHIPYPSIEAVAGTEFSLSKTIVSAEYSCKRTIGFKELSPPVIAGTADPGEMFSIAADMAEYEFALLNRKIFRQQARYNHAIALNLSRNFLNDELMINLSAIGNVTSSELLLRGSLEWRISDILSAGAGINHLSGREKSPYYYTKGVINGLFCQIKVSF
ncbi:MAG: hypothetical protein PHP30_03460 [Bacteroidales bacterium]|jgi:hypothetical protein|nr:hypothetical protein [Bacteroidales bacterium]MDD2424643.1 hypothetical protein [Bacteroidales bacterium]MDD3989137.1 hypothetical protein [Bacteroidales bacterium]MDD4638853.1 hypothetical protein [Bacteroidales bacterium]